MLLVRSLKFSLVEARRPSSKKWTSFPKEYVAQIRSVFQESFAPSLGHSVLVVEGKIFAEEICLRVGFREHTALRQNNFEISVDFNSNKDNAVEKIYQCIDAVAMLITSYFDGTPASDYPNTWKLYEFEKKPVYFQFSTINTDLENAADALLGEENGTLVIGEEPDHNPKSDLLH